MKLHKAISAKIAAVIFMVAAISCNPDTPEDKKVEELLLFIPKPEVSYASGSQFIYVTADGRWSIDADFGDEAAWAELSVSTGNGSQKGITLQWNANAGSASRRCVLTLNCGGEQTTSVLLQAGKGGDSQPVAELKSDPVADWMELPATNTPGLYFITHDMTVGSYKGRNYSFYFDPSARESIWVAYPLNKALIGNGSRTNEWGLDPKVPTEYQAVLFSGFRGANYGEWYDRGHQLPSADRLASGVNQTTFYGTNMTPQLGDLNQKAWAALEGYVRNWAASFDTLYVVTGADLNGSTKLAYDNYNKEVKVPVGYYKALLGYRRSGSVGISGSTGGYTGTAFYFEHKSYTNNAATVMGQMITIDELERKVGVDFFVNLPAKVGNEKAAKVEATADDWWKNIN